MVRIVIGVSAALLAAGAQQVSAQEQANPLSLSDCIQIALKKNPTLASSAAGVRSAQAGVLGARSSFGPNIDLSASASNSRATGTGLDGSWQARYSVSSGISYPLYTGGRNEGRLVQARASLTSSTSSLLQQQIGVAYDVKLAYFGVLRADVTVATREKIRERADAVLNEAQAKFDVGYSPKGDVLKAAADLAGADLDLIRAKYDSRTARAGLLEAMGLDPGGDIELSDTLEFVPRELDKDKLLADALRDRPEMASSAAQIQSAKAQLEIARSYKRPSVNLSASRAFSDDRFFPSTGSWSYGLSLSYPIFDAGATKASELEALAGIDQALADEAYYRQTISLEIEEAYLNAQVASESVGAAKKFVESATEAREIALGRYQVQKGTLLEVTDAEATLASAELSEIQARYDYVTALAAVDRAVARW
jgi:outer membrane protein